MLWLQGVRFIVDGKSVAPRRLLMIDDLHKLRRQQRSMLIEELTELRPSIPVWLAERNIVLGDDLIAQGTRESRDVHQYALEDLWGAGKGHQFQTFAQNILDRRLQGQSVLPAVAFAQYLRDDVLADDVRSEVEKGVETLRGMIAKYKTNPRYREWISHVERHLPDATVGGCRLVVTPLGSKLITVGAGLACFEMRPSNASANYGVAIPHAEPKRYVVAQQALLATKPEVSALVLTGDAYRVPSQTAANGA